MPYCRHREDMVTGPYDLKLLCELSEFKKRSSEPSTSYQTLFPNLRWLQLPSAHHASFAPMLFLGDQLNSLSLPWINSLDEYNSLFNAILTHVPNLVTLDLGTGKGLPFRECSELSQSICGLKSLQRLTTGSLVLDTDSILHLASLPYLQTVQLPNSASNVLQSLSELSSHPFSGLQCLQMSTSTLKPWPAFLERLKPHHLRTIRLDCTHLPSTEDIHEFFLALSDSPSQPHMHSVHLTQPWSSLPSLAPKVATGLVVDFWILAPLLVFDNLTKLDFTLACSLSFDDQDIATMAASWPKLQHLQLGSPLGWGQPSGITLRGILALVKACPELEHLGLTLDASSLPYRTASELELDTEPLNAKICARTSSVNTKITYLQVGDSSIEDARAVADFLYPIFPNVRGIGGVWLYLRAGSFTHQERECHSLWQDVASFMREAHTSKGARLPAVEALRNAERPSLVTNNSASNLI
jgi:hypothetical protein